MKTLKFFTWQEGLDILMVALWLSISIAAGFMLPPALKGALPPSSQSYLLPLTTLIAAASGAIIWCLIRSFEPKQYGNKWTVARFVIILTIWLSVITALYFLYASQGPQDQMLIMREMLKHISR